MKTLYLDCSMGAAGDMLAAALLELAPDPDTAISRLNALGIPGVEYSREKVERCGIVGTHLIVRVHGEEEGESHHEHEHHHEHHHIHDHHHHHHHEHHSLDDILHMVCGLSMPEAAKRHVEDVYRLLADAESRAHGRAVGEIHFHEVGALDAVADIAAVSCLICELGVDQIIASPVNMGGGTVRCAHGVLPVPAPATAFLLEGVPAHSDDPALGELCTPTGAALLKHFAHSFGRMPVMRVSAIGHGAGGRSFDDRANFVRASLGESTTDGVDEVYELVCNVDDMTGEEMAFASERLFAAGALDVVIAPVQMKKGRPGAMFTVLCSPAMHDAVVAAMFKHTSTIGVRETLCRRHVLSRREVAVPAPDGGTLRRKDSEGYGTHRSKYEHDDLARAARSLDVSIREVMP